ncbi:hypothetical protein [Pseudoalteromonas luteoviolacea]|uniref:MalT-like TPR region domain-containing protein n=1 Tax=Pseudoalteromonas luteoviolacea S4060-1 TaxID=1365257 RepID=A0A167PAH2_9GAMM|nr:hypothetical protein [Pseudoalteromonas luteoviolacea]KZN69863.1 hypothetical protein N478_10225 [Pseudoalteromonas luteoviolacea S4060-1]
MIRKMCINTVVAIMLLSQTYAAAGSKPVADDIKYLARNKPDEAIKEFEKIAKRLLNQDNTETILIYKDVLVAASSTKNMPLVEQMIKLLSAPRLAPYITPYLFVVTNAIGVAYRRNGQFDEAISAYKCTFKYAFNDIDKMTVKVNLAIAYRMKQQPAISFQLLQSIDEAILNGNRKAGLLVVKGNTAVVLGKAVDAVKFFSEARNYYLKVQHKRSAERVTVNLLGAALISRKLDIFDHYRTKLAELPDNYLPDSDLAYLAWLDLMHESVVKNTMAADVISYTIQHVPKLIEYGYVEHVSQLLDSLDAGDLVPKRTVFLPPETKLKSGLASTWCQDL